MAIGQKFTQELTQKTYDVIIIGSGISGLTLASLQAKQGKSVLVLEKHYTAGGFTHTYQRKGFEWDSGLHYVGEVHKEDHPFRILFDFISDKNLNWKAMPDVYDKFIYPDRSFSIPSGEEAFRAFFLREFSTESQAIDLYLTLIKQCSKTLQRMTFVKALPFSISSFMSPFERSDLFRQSTYDVLKKLTQNEKLISVFCGLWGDYGLPPKQSSFGVHAIIAHHYLDGAAFPVGGSSEVARTIVKGIEEKGGKVIVSCGVKSILTQNNEAYGVVLENGEKIEGKKIVSSTGLHQTYMNLLAPEQLPDLFLTKVGRLNPSLGYLSLNIGVNKDPSFLAHPGENLWDYSSYNHDQNFQDYFENPLKYSPPMTYLSFPCLKDSDWKQRMGQKTTIDILGLADYQWFEKWKNSSSHRRDPDYTKFKEQLVRPYFDSLYRLFPQLKNNIDHYEISTPLTVKHYLNYQRGETYGLNLEPQRFNAQWVRPKTPIKNFYLTGQDVLLNGVCGAMMSGVLTSTVMSPVSTLGLLTPLGIIF